MMFIGATDVPTCGVDDFREALRVREAELVNAKKQRDAILNDIRNANAAVDKGDQRARLALRGLNKQNVAAGRLILSIEAEVVQAKKRLAIAMNQAAAVEAKRVSVDAAPRDKWFAVSCPDGRAVRHRHSSMDALQKELQLDIAQLGRCLAIMRTARAGSYRSRVRRRC
jgi:hypothetical protein